MTQPTVQEAKLWSYTQSLEIVRIVRDLKELALEGRSKGNQSTLDLCRPLADNAAATDLQP